MALFNNSYSGLITGGLGGPACCGLITMKFHVFKCKIEIITPPVSGGGGGSHPLAPGQIQNFYKPVQPNKTYFPRKPQYQTVIVRVTMNGKTTTTEYKTFPIVAKAIASIINITTVAFDSIKVRVTNIRNTLSSALMKIRRIGTKRDYINPTITDIKNKE